ncbi:EAL domain-containing protein [Butyrivibrio sp. INlla16]|uniref:two-component system response regulator n=1 Tax=Butyrivibrio sp. INlla16 TaxID=1520807 RepID=UPI00088E0768|nr:EAL domain-containing protein [Butyrivibrio sp. INlla16]SDB41154.1 EAL domain, c-di-GMP-specific phosphodiesterase class I (or its enzymatically inactive variant) [Butyrivibrio sp. INlla16]
MDSGLDVKRKILIVEDEPINRKILENIIKKDYEGIFARDGVEAIELIRDNSDTLSLVLLDLMMPDMDGFEVLEFMREDKVLKLIPVIVCTSEKQAEIKCFQLGAADFITKPYDHPAVIKARIDRAIEFREGRGLIHATQNDSLTGLLTHDFFMEYSHFRDLHYNNHDMDAIVLNINRFHLINELQGRRAGDDVLIKIADSAKRISEEKGGIAGRGGADEFMLYLPSGSDPTELLGKIEEGLQDLLNNSRVYLRMGVYKKVNRDLSVEHRFDRARVACNSIRGSYNEKLAVYDEEMNEKETLNERLINDMEAGIEEGQFKIYYQPKYAIQGERDSLYSAEALVRWEHPELGLLRPDKFIPLFEENGLIHKLDHYVWDEVSKQIGEWMVKYDLKIPVSVNVSRVDIGAPDLEEEIFTVVQNNWISPGMLNLEITESAYTENSDQIIKVVKGLRERGFAIEMDDFGTGYSSLNMITSLPIDILKLDMQFVKNIHEGNKDMKMVELMMDVARSLKVKVVAEGVETREQYDLLKKAGCDVIQGFYFSMPCAGPEFEKLIEKENEELAREVEEALA